MSTSVDLQKNEEGTGTVSKLATGVTALVLLQVAAFAAGDFNTTIPGKMIDYAVNDAWGSITAFASGIPLIGGIYKANEAGNLKPFWYGLAAAGGVATGFLAGPSLYTGFKAFAGI